ncbi:hypothetical protein OAB57_01825 [Bacteriovoracaceae bacterium]|nr:hypothetical protein [Bacteriovoracaceae bacterium]
MPKELMGKMIDIKKITQNTKIIASGPLSFISKKPKFVKYSCYITPTSIDCTNRKHRKWNE